MVKKIRKGGAWIQKNVERIPLASFVSRVFQGAKKIIVNMDSREARLGIGLAICVVLLIGLNLFFRPMPVDIDSNTDTEVAQESIARHPFTGAPLLGASIEDVFVLGVMVENSYDAWPLSGLEDAFLVIEAPVEGSIPRFMALFTSDMTVQKIGPVRSARPYYVDWAKGWSAIYHHVGGSPEALDLIASLGVQDVNEFYNGNIFWRSTDRGAPHNVYTSVERLRDHATLKEFTKQKDGFFKFKEMTETGAAAQKVSVQWYSEPSRYDAVWTLEEGMYVRSQGDKAIRSADGDQYKAANIIVLETDIRSIDEKDRKHLRTTGEGEARIYQNGNSTEGTWKKASVEASLEFVDLFGKTIELLPGATWIEVTESLSLVRVDPLVAE